MARVLLIRPSMGSYYRFSPVASAVTLSPHLGLASLSAAVKCARHSVKIWDLEARPISAIVKELEACSPQWVGVHLKTPLAAEGRRLAQLVRRAVPSARLVAGGPHASALPESCLAKDGFHHVIRGEGEEALVALLDGSRDLLMDDSRIVHHPPIQDLDALPLPDWSSFDLRDYRRPSLVAPWTPTADIESSRGCEHACSYCSKLVFGRKFRAKSALRVVEEVEACRRAGFMAYNYVDDTFTADLPRAMSICDELLRRGIVMPWTCTNGLRIDQVSREFFRLARRSGCRLVAFGLESGDEALLGSIGKTWSIDHAAEVVAWAHEAGLVVLGYFMLGLPGETAESMRKTALFARMLSLDFAKFSITMPLPGTPLYDAWRPYMRKELPALFSIHHEASDWFEHPTLRWREIDRARLSAYTGFYLRVSWLSRMALSHRVQDLLRALLEDHDV